MSRYVFNRASTFDDAGFCLPFNGAQVYPDRESYRVMAAEYDYIPFYARAAVTDFDAAGLFKFINPSPPACLLESLSGDDNGRYSIIAFSSLREITAPLDHTRGIDPLREFFATTRVPQLDFPFFSGGLAGYWSYEEALLYQCLPVNKTGFAEQFFFMPGEILVFDRRLNMLMVIIWVKTGGVGEEDYDQACSRLDGRIRQAVNCQGRPGQRPTVFITGRLDQEFRVNIDRDDFCHLVREAQEHIKQGDIFQVVLSRRWSKKSPADPWEVYLNLRSINPSPYMFYLQLPDSVLMGASPEMQVKIEKNRIKSRPIAGTRKITGDALADARMARELLADEKELAEHLMLVDLSRNDIGRVSRSGTVEVDNSWSWRNTPM
jgi:anthranilate synthase component 1